jgi:Rha family phage regulatory protein
LRGKRLFAYINDNFQKFIVTGETQMNELTIIKRNGGAYIDSRQVAEYIGKDHRNLLRDIRGYCEIIEKSNELKIERISFFLESSYVDSRGREKPCYLLSKMGCELCSHKLTGEKGILFTAAYVYRFNELEAAERAEREKRSVTPQLNAFNRAVKNVLAGYANSYATYEDVMDFLRGAYMPFGIEVSSYEGKYKWTATGIAAYLGIFSENGLPHGHAVAAIIEKLKLDPKHIAVIPYGIVGVTIRYDGDVPGAVAGWLAANDLPRDIPHLGFKYHIRYGSKRSLSYQTSFFDDELDDDYEAYYIDDDWFDEFDKKQCGCGI